MAKRVAIIGAGVAGLTSIKSAIDAGLDPTAYERYSWLGGIWNYTEDEERFAVSKATILNISKHYSCLSDFPIPKEMPNYMPAHLFQRYLESCAKEFDLTRRIRFNCDVLKVEKCKDYEDTGRWEIHSVKRAKNDDRAKEDVCVEVYDYVMVCSGILTKPFIPDIPGIDDFTGRKIHSKSYKTFTKFEGRRVLVVGLGNTAGDIACELSRHAKQVYVSTRRGTYVVPRMASGGRPRDISFFTRAVQSIPKSILQWLMLRSLNSTYDWANFGLEASDKKSLEFFLVNDELPHRIVTGTLTIKDEIVHFKDKKVFFKDDTELDDIDDIIFATGYDIEFPFLSKSIFNSETASFGHQLYKAAFPADLSKPTLAFIGVFRVGGAVMPVCEMQARWAMQVFKGEFTLPSKEFMKKDIVARNTNAMMNKNHHASSASYVVSCTLE
ncbi:hypothetical protein QZH41_012821 [Actinostola sp. cb2023]|nr:hypothetical protein QZH41_012821 [Actinostola sp. cb2023]